MVSTELPPNASLAELLSARARRTPHDRLVIDLAGGAVVVAVAAWARPSGWLTIASAAACLAMYGLWALAELRLQPLPWPETAPHESAWRAVRGVAAAVGIGAFVLFLFAALGIALGSIKS